MLRPYPRFVAEKVRPRYPLPPSVAGPPGPDIGFRSVTAEAVPELGTITLK